MISTRVWVLGLALVGGASFGLLFLVGRTPRADFAIANGADPKSLDPARVSGAVAGRILRALLEGLTTEDPRTLDPRPGMAERWEVSADGCRYRFHIRSGASWSNGDPVTARDFEWSWRRLLAPETGGQYAELLWTVVGAKRFHEGSGPWSEVGIRALSAQLLEVVHEHPVPYFLNLAAFYPLLPLHRASVEEAERNGRSFATPGRLIGNGPFLLEARHLRDRIRVRKNPDYWDAAAVRIETLDVLSVESSNTQLNLFLAGELDWVSEVPRTIVPTLMDDARFARVYRPTPYLATYFYRVNTTRPPFDDPALRRALSLATDREEIVRRVTRAGEEVAWSFVPWPEPALRAYAKRYQERAGESYEVRVPFEWYRRAYAVQGVTATAGASDWQRLGYDPRGAREILVARGYRVPLADGSQDFSDGNEFPEVEILYNSSPLHERIAEVIQSQWWKHLGIRVRLTNQEWGSYLNAQQRLDYDVSRSMWIGDYLDPDTFLGIFDSASPNNRTGWSNPEYDELLGRARREVDRAARAELLHRAETILMEELPIIPFFYCVTEGLVGADVMGVPGNALNTLLPKHFARKPRGS